VAGLAACFGHLNMGLREVEKRHKTMVTLRMHQLQSPGGNRLVILFPQVERGRYCSPTGLTEAPLV
jgi:hypothetical protein